MRKVTRLIGKRGPRKAPNDATGYNAFVRPQPTQQQAAAGIPSVHSKVIRQGAGLRVESNPTAAKIQYAALNRLRNTTGSSSATPTPTMRPSSRCGWLRRLGCCWHWRHRSHRRNRRRRSYRNYWRTGAGAASKSKLGCWWRSWCRRGGAAGERNSYHYDSEEEDDDIDAKVAAYVLEMKQREAESSKQSEQSVAETCLAEPAVPGQEQVVPEAGVQRSSSGGNIRQQQQQQRAWTWDDSLRSNSDRFLETLEQDLPGAASAAAAGEGRLRLSLTLRRTPLHVTFHEEVQGRPATCLPAARLPACLPARCMRLSRCTKPKIVAFLNHLFNHLVCVSIICCVFV